jgi:carbonic anhydrase
MIALMSEVEEMLATATTDAERLAAPEMSARPRRGVAVLACMDARIDLDAMLGLTRGDVHIIRNAGGLVTDDAIRSISASQRLLGTTEVIVVMHEDCGLCGASDDEFARALAADGAQPSWRVGAFDDLRQTLRDGLAKLRASPELPMRKSIRGLIFDPQTGRVFDVEGGC